MERGAPHGNDDFKCFGGNQSSSHPLYAVGAASGVGWDESTSMIWVPLTPPLNGERVFLLGQGLLQSIVLQRPNDMSDETTWDFE